MPARMATRGLAMGTLVWLAASCGGATVGSAGTGATAEASEGTDTTAARADADPAGAAIDSAVGAGAGPGDTGRADGVTVDDAGPPASSDVADSAADTGTSRVDDPSPGCGHDIDPAIVELGFNQVRDETGGLQPPQGRPLQEGWTLDRSETELSDHNQREYGRIAAWMMPIRDALQCDLDTLTLEAWRDLTAVLTLNGIKTAQDLSGTPKEQVYSTDGLFEHLKADGADHNATLKYVEEAELELKCLAFLDFDFTNPEGDDHCAAHGLTAGTLLVP